MLYLLAPPAQNCRGIARYLPEEADAQDAPPKAPPPDAKASLADRINHSRVLGGIIALTGVVLLAREFVTDPRGALDLNVFNFGFLMIGMLLYISPSQVPGRVHRCGEGKRRRHPSVPLLRGDRRAS